MDYNCKEEEELQSLPVLADGATSKNCAEKMSGKLRRANLYQSVAILNIVYLACGTTFGWSSPVASKLNITETEGSSIASMLSLGSIIGPLVSGAIGNTLGRKKTVGLAMGLMTVSYLLLTFANHKIFILSLGRFIAGVTCGITLSAVPMYVAEISENSIRGFLSTLNQISMCIGGLIVYSIGPFVTYTVLHYILLGLCFIFALLFPLLPESPHSLLMKSKVKKAKNSLMWLRGFPPNVDKELNAIQEMINQEQSEKGSIKELFTKPSNRRGLVICCGLLIIQQASGISCLLFYTEKIFQYTGSDMSSESAIITAVVSTLSAFICPLAVKYFGYKKPLLVSAAGMAIGMGAIGLFFMLKFNQYGVDSITWLPLLGVIVYITFFNIGFANIPWALSGELFTNNIKPQATALISITCGTTAFLMTFFFFDFVNLMKMDFVFITFSLFSCVAVVFIALIVPETSGLFFSEIQQILNGASSKEIRENHRTFRIKEKNIDDCTL